MKKLLLLLGLAMLTGCAGLGDVLQDIPKQESASVEANALKAQKDAWIQLATALPNLVTRTSIRAADPDKEVTFKNVIIDITFVDSRMYDMLTAAMDYSKYKSSPGFWSFMINLTDKAERAAPFIAPLYFLSDILKNQSATVSGPIDYRVSGSNNQLAVINGRSGELVQKLVRPEVIPPVFAPVP